MSENVNLAFYRLPVDHMGNSLYDFLQSQNFQKGQ